MENRLSSAQRDAVFESLLARHPEALVAAINGDGIFLDARSIEALQGHPAIPGRSALDVVVPTDQVVIIEAWARAKREGAALCHAEVVGTGGERAEIHFVDMSHRLGVFAGILLGSGGDAGATLERLRHTVSVIPKVCRIRKDEMAVVTEVDAATTLILGWTAEDLAGRRTLEIVHPDDQKRGIENWMEMLASPGTSIRWRGRHRCKDGSWLWMDTTNHNQLASDGCVVAEMVDISDEMAAHEALREREELLHRLAEALPLGVFQLDASGTVLYSNSRLAKLLGDSQPSSLDALLGAVAPADRDRLHAAAAGAISHQRAADVEVHLQRGRRTRLCAVNLRPLTGEDGRGSGVVGCLSDITESAQLRAELEHRATVDDLTGCLNRASVLSALEAAAARDAREGTGTGIIFLDLDRFKSVNDRFGHATGDRLLQVVADRLRAAVRSGDLVGRMGGDEFLVVSPGLHSRREGREVARRIAATLEAPVHVGGVTVEPRASLGVVYEEGARRSSEDLIHAADKAMYATKRRRAASTPSPARTRRAS